jgi:methionyl-tRNA formyltransferase
MKVVIVNSNRIHKRIENACHELWNAPILNERSDLTEQRLNELKPDFVFFLHWSFIIPENIYTKFNCIVFHMTDLPYGRGGSPLQNLIVKGHSETKVSAIKVEKGLDTGPVYLKKGLSLNGTAEEIFIRAGDVMLEMMKEIVNKDIQPEPQTGEPVVFTRRKPEDGNLQNIQELNTIYDYIRMLDAEGYPKAFIETEHFKFEFSRASLKSDGIIGDVKITKR